LLIPSTAAIRSGAILLWETDEDVPLQEFAVTQQVNPYASTRLLLDGQPRLTSLAAVIRGEPLTVRGRRRPIELLFNLEHPEVLSLVTEVHEDGEDDEDLVKDEADSTEDEVCHRFSLRLLGLAVVATGLAVALSPPASAASVPCWQRVILDWSKHGSIAGTYPASCLRKAMQNEPTDLKIYSTLDDNLQRALARRSGTARRLAVAPAAVASLDGAGGSSSQLLLIFLIAGLGVIIAASAVAAGRARPRAAGPDALLAAPPRSSTSTIGARVPPTGRTDRSRDQTRSKSRQERATAKRPRPKKVSTRRAARQDRSTIKLAATSGFLVADRNGKLVGRVECPMYGTAPDEPDALAVKAGLFKRNLVMADTIDSIDGATGMIGLSVERDSIPTFL
jgi:hypothetical protein